MANLLYRVALRARLHALTWQQRYLVAQIRHLRAQREYLAGFDLAENERQIRGAEWAARAIDARILELRDELGR